MTPYELLKLGNFGWLDRITMNKPGYGGTYISLDEIIEYNCYSNGYINFNDIYNNYWLDNEENVSGYFIYTLDFDNLPIEQCNLSFEDGILINSINVSVVDADNNIIANVLMSENNYYNITLDTIESDNSYNVELDNLFIDTITTYWTSPYSSTDEMYVLNRFNYETAWYNVGYSSGQTYGYNNGYSTGYSEGQTYGYNNGYNVGYNDGFSVGSNSNQVIGNAIVSVADTPLSIFKSIFDVDIMGFNLASCLLGIAGLTLIIWVIRKFLGGE